MIVSNFQHLPAAGGSHQQLSPVPRQALVESRPDQLVELLRQVVGEIPPLWPLPEFVAVNPCVALSHQGLLEVHRHLRYHAGAQLLQPLSYFREAFSAGRFNVQDIDAALAECLKLQGSSAPALTTQQIINRLTSDAALSPLPSTESALNTLAELIDRQQGTDWKPLFDDEIAKHLAAHFDEGQAMWRSPWQHLSFYNAWKKAALVDPRVEYLGLRGFRSFVATLPANATGCIRYLLSLLAIPNDLRRAYLTRHLYASYGWACYLKGLDDRDESNQFANENLLGLLAARLAYDAALIVSLGSESAVNGWTLLTDHMRPDTSDASQADEFLRLVCQTACEISYRRELVQRLCEHRKNPRAVANQHDVQMVFCIDVRSEPFRRHLENVSPRVETLGFAGFFGIPFEYVPLGEKTGRAQCPVLLTPKFRIAEGLADSDQCNQLVERRKNIRGWRTVWKSFKSSAASCFSYIESTGLLFALKLATDSWGLTKPASKGQFDGVPQRLCHELGPVLEKHANFGLSLEERTEIARAILHNLGLTTNFARLIVFCGHESATVNNPFRASLDCGACGGKSGQVNAILAAAILNDPQVRSQLSHQGIEIPADTQFLSSVHNTTTDEIRFTRLPSQTADSQLFRDLTKWLNAAGMRTRDERARLLGCAHGNQLLRRARDWSEVRPEWGLAGNAAFIVGSRRWTAGLNLGGRAFLHNYEYQRDPEGKILELIMTAPMIVTNWINMQYYAATVDNGFFGGGDKVLHNVLGKLGVVAGNGGDLRPGLPLQSVHDGQKYHHEALRLLVMIEAPRSAMDEVISKHAMVRDLVLNKWIRLVSVEGTSYFECRPDRSWEVLA